MALLEIFYCEFVQNLAIENLGLSGSKPGSAKNWTRIQIQHIACIRILKKKLELTVLEFLNRLWGLASNRVGKGLSYRTARLHRLADPGLLKSSKIPSLTWSCTL
jgi:hypothetical protein